VTGRPKRPYKISLLKAEIPAALHKQFKEKAKRQKITQTEALQNAMKQYLQPRQPKTRAYDNFVRRCAALWQTRPTYAIHELLHRNLLDVQNRKSTLLYYLQKMEREGLAKQTEEGWCFTFQHLTPEKQRERLGSEFAEPDWLKTEKH
jgi:hypothetical protein